VNKPRTVTITEHSSGLSISIPASAEITDIEIKDSLGGGNFSEVFKGEYHRAIIHYSH
jgi:hypothetical protein